MELDSNIFYSTFLSLKFLGFHINQTGIRVNFAKTSYLISKG